MAEATANKGWLQTMFQGNRVSANQPQPKQADNQNNNQNNNNQNNNQNNNNNNQNNNNNDPNNRQTTFDAYKDLWKDADSKATTPPPFELSDEIVNKSAGSLDFLRDHDQGELQSLREHFGDKADLVFGLINSVGRKAYANAMKHTAGVTNKYLEVRRPFDSKATGAQVREHMVTSTLDQFERAQENPIIRDQLQQVGKRLLQANPDATPEWIAEKVKDYFTQMGNFFNPKEQEKEKEQESLKKPGGLDFDWEGFVDPAKAQQQQGNQQRQQQNNW